VKFSKAALLIGKISARRRLELISYFLLLTEISKKVEQDLIWFYYRQVTSYDLMILLAS